MRCSIRFGLTLLTLGALVFAADARAGEQSTNTASCGPTYTLDPYTHLRQVSGYACSGTLAGFRDTTNTTDFAEFFSQPSYGSFEASYNGTYYTCVAPSSMLSVWPSTVASRGYYFDVFMDLNGNCTRVELWNGSRWPSF